MRIDNYYFVDLLLPNEHLCIEVDGAHHYHGVDQGMRKRFQMKQRVLEKLGYTVARIDLAQYMRKSDITKRTQIVQEMI